MKSTRDSRCRFNDMETAPERYVEKCTSIMLYDLIRSFLRSNNIQPLTGDEMCKLYKYKWIVGAFDLQFLKDVLQLIINLTIIII